MDSSCPVMSSAVRRLGQEISKLGLRMRNRSPSGSDSEVFSSTDELAAKEVLEGQQESAFSADTSSENRGASGSVDEMRSMRQRRHSRNELDEDVECGERRSSIKAALRPVLSRKSRSDLAKYSRPNQKQNLKQGPLERNGSENSVKENNVDGIMEAKNGKGKGKEMEVSTMAYRVAMKSEVIEHVDKTTKPRKSRMKRSKSFSGMLGWRQGSRQGRKDSAEIDGCHKVLRRTNSFNSKVDNSNSSLENSITISLQNQVFMTPDRNNSSKISPDILVAPSSNGDEFARNGHKALETRLSYRSYMALKGFRCEEGMIETDLCSTEL